MKNCELVVTLTNFGSQLGVLEENEVCEVCFFFVCLFFRKAFQLYYKEFVEVSCPTEDIYLE